jgi:hypothetical protein
MTPRIETICVRDPQGRLVSLYAPNHIGSTESQLLEKAKAEAGKIQGTVIITRSK